MSPEIRQMVLDEAPTILAAFLVRVLQVESEVRESPAKAAVRRAIRNTLYQQLTTLLQREDRYAPDERPLRAALRKAGIALADSALADEVVKEVLNDIAEAFSVA